MSEAVYFRDPDGNGIEISYELPVEEWPSKENVFDASKGRFPGPWDKEHKVQARLQTPQPA